MDTFDMFRHADEAVEPFEPTEDDMIEDCDECGEEFVGDECPFCFGGAYEFGERDVDNYDEYEGPFGLWGGEQFEPTYSYDY